MEKPTMPEDHPQFLIIYNATHHDAKWWQNKLQLSERLLVGFTIGAFIRLHVASILKMSFPLEGKLQTLTREKRWLAAQIMHAVGEAFDSQYSKYIPQLEVNDPLRRFIVTAQQFTAEEADCDIEEAVRLLNEVQSMYTKKKLE